MAKITFNIQQGGLGRRRPGRDYVSGLVYIMTDANLPAGFGVNDRIKKVENLAEAEALGISGAATANIQVRILHYHIAEFFRIYEGRTASIGELWIHLVDDLAGLAAVNFTDLQNAAVGEIRQFAAYTSEAYAASLVTAASAAMETMIGASTPAVAIVSADHTGTAAVGDFADVRGLGEPYVSVDIAQDGTPGSTAAALAAAAGRSVCSAGTMLGALASALVSHNIGWVREFNLSNALTWLKPVLANDLVVSELSDAETAGLDTKGLIYASLQQGVSGAYYSDTHQAVAVDNDFGYLENSRTIQKALREVNAVLTPFKNAPVFVNATTGKISETTIFELESAVLQPLNVMANDGELSADQETGELPATSVFIDPDQNVLATSKINITVRLVPVGTQRETVVNIGFTPKISS